MPECAGDQVRHEEGVIGPKPGPAGRGKVEDREPDRGEKAEAYGRSEAEAAAELRRP